MSNESKNKDIHNYINAFKEEIVRRLDEFKKAKNVKKNVDNVDDLKSFITNYKNLEFSKQICLGKLESGAQCKRIQQPNSTFCKKHMECVPFGLITDHIKQPDTNNNVKKLNLFIQHINGIPYFVDKDKNIYNSESILSKNAQPIVIGNIKQYL